MQRSESGIRAGRTQLWVALDSGMRDVQLIAIPAVHRTYPLYHEHRQGPTDIGHLLSRWQVKVWSITSRSPIFTFDVHEERRRKLYRIPPQIHVNRTSSLQETTKRFGFGTIFPNRAFKPSKAIPQTYHLPSIWAVEFLSLSLEVRMA